VDVATDVVAGIAAGCELAGAALIGGETAEMPDMYPDGEYDLAGFCVGAVEREQMIDGQAIVAGDELIGIASSGPHSNGYSLIRKVLEIDGNARIDGKPARDVLLEPTRIYVKPLLELMQKVTVKGLSHITGGGISENLPRVLPDSQHARIDGASWRQGPVFDWLATAGNIAEDEMRRTFNCGVGMIVAVDAADLGEALSRLRELGEDAWHIGSVSDGAGTVEFC
jgi:phosphoribosylformylglycinamidine cyclo-ligase